MKGLSLFAMLLGLVLIGPAYGHDTVYYYSSDQVQSEVVITDASRDVVEQTHYAPYGQVLNRTLRDGPGYSGHEEDPETSLVYMQQRYYDAESGRFVSSDPLATTDDGDSFNRYAYVNDNPYRYMDPSGECFWDACVMEGIGAAEIGAMIVAAVATKSAMDAQQTIHDHLHNEAAPGEAPKTDKPSAPPGNNGTTESPHGSPEHDAKVNEEVQKMRDKNYGDIRKNQAQVDAQGNKVGNNRPDVQGTNPETGQREHVEVDRNPNRGLQHEQDILRNDPAAKCTRLPCPS